MLTPAFHSSHELCVSLGSALNLAGIKVACAELEAACADAAQAAGVAELAAVGVPLPTGGPDALFIFVVLRPSPESPEAVPAGPDAPQLPEGADADAEQQRARQKELQAALQAAVSAALSPQLRISGVRVVPELPRTPTGKVRRVAMRAAVLLEY